MNVNLLKEMLELFHAALGPAEAALRMTQVRHNEPILPRTVSGPGAAQVTWRWRAVVDTAESMNDEAKWG